MQSFLLYLKCTTGDSDPYLLYLMYDLPFISKTMVGALISRINLSHSR
jgi:hypothetical protein